MYMYFITCNQLPLQSIPPSYTVDHMCLGVLQARGDCWTARYVITVTASEVSLSSCDREYLLQIAGHEFITGGQ